MQNILQSELSPDFINNLISSYKNNNIDIKFNFLIEEIESFKAAKNIAVMLYKNGIKKRKVFIFKHKDKKRLSNRLNSDLELKIKKMPSINTYKVKFII